MASAASLPRGPRRRFHRYLWILWALAFAVVGPFALVLFWTFAADSSLGEIPLLFAWALAAVVALGIAIWWALSADGTERSRWACCPCR